MTLIQIATYYKSLNANYSVGDQYMDDKTRGNIENMIDEVIEQVPHYNINIGWIFGDIPELSEIDLMKPASSRREFLLGYFLGRIYTQAWQIMLKKPSDTDEDFQELEDIIKTRLPEIQNKVEFTLNMR